jgi:hypothetical protein
VYAKTRDTVWSCFAERALSVLAQALPLSAAAPTLSLSNAAPSLDGVRRLTDDCGMLQHSLFDVPDRRHGYCVDDNARALLLMHRLPGPVTPERRRLTRIYAAFVQHAWNSNRGRFRNFMSYERVWLEEAGSEDSTGRAFWSVADTLAYAADPALRRWAESLVGEILPYLTELTSPRAIAFALLGLSELVEAGFGGEDLLELASDMLAVLKRLLACCEAEQGPWFEMSLAYDNARLPEAMIRTGAALADRQAVAAGLRTLKWLRARQTSKEGLFVPVATGDLGLPLDARTLYDQQPIEAAAMADACEAAFRVTQDTQWSEACVHALAWYFGGNTLGSQIAQPFGDCFDGLTWKGPNENMGAESVLSLQLAICAHARVVAYRLDATKTAVLPLS